ncbi:MAG: hypothetical protein KME45_28145 [Stenomitos rutilans HA7619-LM2]|jgi:hypothetical protein|nr:hypothetical protein [Stenomitos rutilans HA7619-LM2]
MPILRKPTPNKTATLRWAAIAGLITVGLLTGDKPAYAFGVTYNFTVQITSNAYEVQGLLSGMTEQGSFTYDTDVLTPYSSIGVIETSSEQYASASRGDLTLTFNFLNNIYTEKNDLNYGDKVYEPDYPAALFTNGKLTGLDFLVVPSLFQPPQNALGFRIYKDAFYAGAIGSSASENGLQVGTVSYINAADIPAPPPPSTGVAAVPEPSEIGGAIVAASVLGFWIKKAKGKR